MNYTRAHAKSRPGTRPRQKPTSRTNPQSTRDAVLDTAEKLFAERGVAATSIRDITRAAGVNLGAINYHFMSKQQLVLAVFARRIDPVSGSEQALLDEVARQAGPNPPRLEAVLEAMVRPSVERSFAAGKRNVTFMRLLGRCMSEPNPELMQWLRARLQKTIVRFEALLQRALPELPHDELIWRMKFSMGALHNILLTAGQEDSLPAEMREGMNAETMIRRLVTFAAAGMRASV
jgi:AcrR family transcriptional regulator